MQLSKLVRNDESGLVKLRDILLSYSCQCPEDQPHKPAPADIVEGQRFLCSSWQDDM